MHQLSGTEDASHEGPCDLHLKLRHKRLHVTAVGNYLQYQTGAFQRLAAPMSAIEPHELTIR